ncbi:hypothetical protein [Mucilaginibacter sp. dw_454]|uniref:VHL beta domain-containing protein n=1 Tax=Mucilaginibacter sp. dw_454 TaxID=2720079 RepID=UPI001BD3397C|nr:hypothetical protein [Mucilaginibacter sp. dw_454]
MTACLALSSQAQQAIIKVTPPVFGFYSKLLDCGGIMIRSSNEVDDKALQVAAQKINLMLTDIPNIRYNLAQWGAEIHIISKNQQTSDLPEFRGQKDVPYVDTRGTTTNIDQRTRGMGGIYTSCGEENLLNLPGDRYAGGSDICIHEFAHNIMDYGLDDGLKAKIKDQYHKAIAKGLWKDAYAAINQGEYWAELSMWYFGAHGEFLKGTQTPAPGPAALAAYDAEGFALLKAIYTGKLSTPKADVAAAQSVGANTKSTGMNQKVYIMFTNNTNQKLKLFWIDYLGKARPYGELSPYNKSIQKTFAGNVWKVTNPEGKVIGFYTTNAPYAMATISLAPGKGNDHYN